MNDSPTTRPRHALRWVVGVGLVFVVVVGMGLQVARSRADERWDSVMSHWEIETRYQSAYESGYSLHLTSPPPALDPPSAVPSEQRVHFMGRWTETTGGNIFKSWRRCQWTGRAGLVLRQERTLFGSRIEAGMSVNWFQLVNRVRQILAEVDVDLVVEL